jgi:hypothetical protein
MLLVTRFRRALVTSCLAFGLNAPTLLAQTADDATRAAARSLGYEGIADFQAGNFAAAADKLDRAYRALSVPSLGLWSARALEKTGKLVAAAERYLEVQRLDPGSGGAVDVQRQAQADAKTEHAALLPRIPNIIIQVEGAAPQEVAVTVNGAPVPGSLIGIKRPVDPGSVKLEADHGGRHASETATLREGESKTVTLRFAPASAVESAAVPAAVLAAPPAAPPAPNAANQPADAASASSGSGLRTIGFVTLAAGGVGIITGAVTGLVANSRKGSIEGCEDTRCPPSASDDVESYNQLRTVSSVAFIGGGVLAATGIVLVLTAPSAKPASSARTSPLLELSPWLGPGMAGVWLEGRR